MSSSQYPPSQPGGGVGVAGTFELDAADDVVKFIYSFTNDEGFLDKEVPADAEGNATIRWTPRVAGTHRFFVSSMNRAGVYSEIPLYEFTVLPGGGPVAHWPLDGGLTDTNGQNALVPNGNPDLAVAGHVGKGVRLNAAQDHLGGAAPVDTSKNFTLSAWAKVDRGDASRAVVATSDSTASSSGLYFDAGSARWAFGMTAAADRAALSVARSRDAAETGVWTHLAGTYDATTRILALHVDGAKQGEVTGVEGWQASQLLVGRLRWNSAEITGSPGAADEIKVYARTLSDAEIKVLAGQVGLRAHYRFGEGAGGSTADDVTGAAATIGGNTVWETDGDDTSLLFNGPDSEGREGEAYVSAPSPGIRTDRSFSISAWARLDLDARDGKSRTVLSLVHNGTSLLDLRSGGASRKWELVTGGTTLATGYELELQEWTYLTAVHDKARSELRLYFSGVYVTSVPFTGGSATTESTVEFGRLAPGATEGFWKGGIDDVRVYAGVLSREQIVAQAVRV
ncbi:LamG domain-containing protein [Lentzea sp. HUAS TT2]|uniref:LamG domain-containing protein n=1 Tax=Lentzea sp. HUAS TT2 TaxID=3447454 RepID=UPI003F7105A8